MKNRALRHPTGQQGGVKECWPNLPTHPTCESNLPFLSSILEKTIVKQLCVLGEIGLKPFEGSTPYAHTLIQMWRAPVKSRSTNTAEQPESVKSCQLNF